jgi:hypothetical protein
VPGFDLRAKHGLEAEMREDLDQLVDHLRDRVGDPHRWHPARQGDIDRFGRQLLLDGRLLEAVTNRGECGLEFGSQCLGSTAGDGSLFLWQSAEPAQEQCDLALLAEPAAFPLHGSSVFGQVSEPGDGLGTHLGDISRQTVLDLVQFLTHAGGTPVCDLHDKMKLT